MDRFGRPGAGRHRLEVQLAVLLAVLAGAMTGCGEPAAPGPVDGARVAATSNYTLHILGVPPGFDAAVATDINSAGTIVGWGRSDSPVAEDRAFEYANGQWTVLQLSRAYGINDAGWIAGSYAGSPAILSPAGALTILDRDGAPVAGVAFDINVGGMVVGKSKTANGHWEATRWNPHNGLYFAQSLEFVPALESQATALNDAGEIVGSVTHPPDRVSPARREAWIWHSGPLGESLGEADEGDDAVATAINGGGFLNPQGFIVGYGNTEPGGNANAVVRPVAGAGLVAMSLPGDWSVLTDVSDRGRLVGWYTDQHPFSLPYDDPAVGGLDNVPLQTTPFTRIGGKRIDLAHFAIAPSDGGGASAVNACGTIVGHISTEVSLLVASWTKPLCDP